MRTLTALKNVLFINEEFMNTITGVNQHHLKPEALTLLSAPPPPCLSPVIPPEEQKPSDSISSQSHCFQKPAPQSWTLSITLCSASPSALFSWKEEMRFFSMWLHSSHLINGQIVAAVSRLNTPVAWLSAYTKHIRCMCSMCVHVTQIIRGTNL